MNVQLAVVYPGAHWILANVINGQHVKAAVCFENIEAMSPVAGDKNAVKFVASAQKRPIKFDTATAV